MKADEHAETAPVESVAFATRLLLAFAVKSLVGETLKVLPAMATALPTWPTPQEPPTNTLTVVPAVAVPAMVGRMLLPGEAGVDEVRDGVVGAAAVVKLQFVAASAFPAGS